VIDKTNRKRQTKNGRCKYKPICDHFPHQKRIYLALIHMSQTNSISPAVNKKFSNSRRILDNVEYILRSPPVSLTSRLVYLCIVNCSIIN